MDRRTVSENREHFQTILRSFENDPKLVVEDVTEEAGTKIGDNYMSVVMRTIVNGKRGDGKPYHESFITKHCPHYRAIAKLARNADLFQNEAHVYKEILPHFDNIAPRCIYADNDEICLEDLRVHGYDVQPRRELLDFEHAAMVVKKFASLHAQSLALKLRDPVLFHNLMSPLKEALFPNDDEPSLGITMDSSFDVAIKQVLSLNDTTEELVAVINYVKSHQGRAYISLKALVTPSGRGKFDVISHGDAWNNNIVFKHDQTGAIIDVKLLDFQIVRHTSIAIDFHYFVYSSVKSSVIENNYDELVKIYQANLQKHLRKVKVDEKIIDELSLNWVKDELRKYAKYGLFTSFWLVNAVLADDEDAINMDDLTGDGIQEMFKKEPPIKKHKAERIRSILLHYMRTYM